MGDAPVAIDFVSDPKVNFAHADDGEGGHAGRKEVRSQCEVQRSLFPRVGPKLDIELALGNKISCVQMKPNLMIFHVL